MKNLEFGYLKRGIERLLGYVNQEALDYNQSYRFQNLWHSTLTGFQNGSRFVLYFVFLAPLIVWSPEVMAIEEDLSGEVQPPPAPVPTLYSKIVLPCEKANPNGDKCSFFAIYDKRDDIVYVVRKTVGQEEDLSVLDRDTVISEAQESFDLVSLFSEASDPVDNASALFEYKDGQLNLKFNILFTGQSERTQKTSTVTY